MAMAMCWEVNELFEIHVRQDGQESAGVVFCGIINVDVEIASDQKWVWCGGN